MSVFEMMQSVTTGAATVAPQVGLDAGTVPGHADVFQGWAPPARRDTSNDATLFSAFIDEAQVTKMSTGAQAAPVIAGVGTVPAPPAPVPTTDPVAAGAVLRNVMAQTDLRRPGRRLGNNDIVLGAGVDGAAGVVSAIDRGLRQERGLTADLGRDEDFRRASWHGEGVPQRQEMRNEGLTPAQRQDLGRALRSANALTSFAGVGVIGSPPLEVELLLSNVVALGRGGAMTIGATGGVGGGSSKQHTDSTQIGFKMSGGDEKAGTKLEGNASYTTSDATTDSRQWQAGSSASTGLAGEDQEGDLKVKVTDTRDGATAYAPAGRIRLRHGE